MKSDQNIQKKTSNCTRFLFNFSRGACYRTPLEKREL